MNNTTHDSDDAAIVSTEIHTLLGKLYVVKHNCVT